MTRLDDALALEAVYYSAPIPRDLATLTVLGTVFDKVYFPGVYLPKDGFDEAALDREIDGSKHYLMHGQTCSLAF
jgi:hypothetical protein